MTARPLATNVRRIWLGLTASQSVEVSAGFLRLSAGARNAFACVAAQFEQRDAVDALQRIDVHTWPAEWG
jgi:hypothetical protein